jgi:hypothetical protein
VRATLFATRPRWSAELLRWAQRVTAPLAAALDRALRRLPSGPPPSTSVRSRPWDQLRLVRVVLLSAMMVSLLVATLPTGDVGVKPGTPISAARPSAGPAPERPATPTATPRPSPMPTATPTPTSLPQLPRGGREVFPRYRLVGYAGGPGSEALGRLGIGDPDARVAEIERLGRSYAGGRQVLPVLEVITVIAHDKPGRNGRYNGTIDAAEIDRWLAVARRHRAVLLLDIQPGRSDFLPLVKSLQRWLVQPDVGVALDPEWAVGPGQVPGRVFGSTTGAELDQVAAYLDGLTRSRRLPQKIMVVHQLAPRVIRRLDQLRPYPGVVVIKSVDGIGSPAAKTDTWNRLVAGLEKLPGDVHPGFKLFFEEDARGASTLMGPAEVMRLRPTPEYILYE